MTALREAASVADAMRFEVDLIQEEGGLYRANPREEIMLRYYANSIAHLLPAAQPELAAAE